MAELGHFPETETFAKTQVSRHEMSQETSRTGLRQDETDTLLKCFSLSHCQGIVIKTHYSIKLQQSREQPFHDHYTYQP